VRAAIGVLALVLCASPAWAQQPSTPGTSDTPIRVERIENGFTASADYKLTWLGGDTGQLAGFTAGYLIEDLFFVGGAGYWLVSGAPEWDLGYGGVLVGIRFPAAERVAFGVKGLTGVGYANVRTTFHNGFIPVRMGREGRWHLPGPTPPVNAGDIRVEYSDNFFVFEPAADVQVTVTRHIRFGVAAGYRLTSGHYAPNGDDLNGATVTASLQFGLGR
jgi:hypothetical protein